MSPQALWIWISWPGSGLQPLPSSIYSSQDPELHNHQLPIRQHIRFLTRASSLTEGGAGEMSPARSLMLWKSCTRWEPNCDGALHIACVVFPWSKNTSVVYEGSSVIFPSVISECCYMATIYTLRGEHTTSLELFSHLCLKVHIRSRKLTKI